MKKLNGIDIIDLIYTDATYSAKYGLDIFITIVIVVTCLALIGYFSMLNNLHKLRANWNEERCKPGNLPFVHIINPDPNRTASEQISDNINLCSKEAIKGIASDSLNDIFDQFDLFSGLKKYIDEFIFFFQRVFKWLFSLIAYVINLLISILQRTFLGLVHIFLKLQDMFNKAIGIIVTNLFILIQAFNMGMAMIMNFASIATLMIMIPLTITIAILTAIILVLTIIATILIMLAWIPFGIGAALAAIGYIIMGVVATLTITLIATLVVYIIMVLVCAALISIQNSAKRFIEPSLSSFNNHQPRDAETANTVNEFTASSAIKNFDDNYGG